MRTLPAKLLANYQKDRQPIACLTAYSASMASLLDEHVDLILVGDSLGMVLYGLPSTVGVTMDMMERHGQAVVNASKQALVVVDLPFGSYQASPEQAFKSAAHLMKTTGCQAVKLEGGEAMAETVAFLVQRGIPVMGHIGLTPQLFNTLGGYKVQGKTMDSEQQLQLDIMSVADAGAFAIVIEGVKEEVAKTLTESTPALTIGIGASQACNGQILVTDDLLGMHNGYYAKFVRRYADIYGTALAAVEQYGKDVRLGFFPGAAETY